MFMLRCTISGMPSIDLNNLCECQLCVFMHQRVTTTNWKTFKSLWISTVLWAWFSRLHLFVIIRGKCRTSHFTTAANNPFLSSLLPNQHLTRVVALSWKSQSAIQRSQHGRHSSLWKQLSVDRIEKLQMLYPQVDTHGNPDMPRQSPLWQHLLRQWFL